MAWAPNGRRPVALRWAAASASTSADFGDTLSPSPAELRRPLPRPLHRHAGAPAPGRAGHAARPEPDPRRLGKDGGHEENGLFHMPVGESGNPLSPYYRDGHKAWEKGEATPFLPGPAWTS